MPGPGSIDGIISSLDTTSIINAILQYDSDNISLIQARQQQVTNEMTAWNSVSAYLLSFKAQASILSRDSAWNTKSATNSDDTVFTADVDSDATPGIYYISVDALAQQHQLASQGFSSSDATLGTGSVVISAGDNAARTITIDSDNNTLSGLRDAINSADAGVTASIINDGSSGNAYRLILTSNETGAENAISVSMDLTNGDAPDFVNSSFDTPETLTWNDNATSSVSLGSNASYTGTENKTYTFTIGGTGDQTIGDGDITVNWTDGTNSGTITVSAADTEVALTGDGSDGLTLQFSAGVLHGGDTFQVQTFSPELQQARDAEISIGQDNPIHITSASNTISDVIDGVTLNLLDTSTSGPNTLTIDIDKNGIADNIQNMIDQYNSLMDYIDGLMDYNPDTQVAGTLIGDMSLVNLQNFIHNLVVNPIDGLPSSLNRLMDVGVITGSDGHLSLDQSTLFEKLDENLDGVINLFKAAGSSDNDKVEYIAMTDDTVIDPDGYDVNITQVATQGSYQGTGITDPSVENLTIGSDNYKFKVRVNGVLSGDIELTQKTYTSGDELAQEIQSQINADDTLGANDVTVSWVDNGDTGYFQIQSTKYGSDSNVETLSSSENSAALDLGFASGTSTAGVDVEGTINGESATGSGQILTGDAGNENTSGLSLKITLTADDLNDNAPEATVTLTRGIASLLSYEINSYTDAYDGSIASRVNGLQSQIDLYNDQIDDLNARLEKRRNELYQEFYTMEQTLNALQSQQSYFSAQIASLGN